MKIVINTALKDDEKQKIFDAFPDFEFIEGPFTQDKIDNADVIVGNPPLSMNLNQENLKAILLNSAGSDQYCKEGILNSNTVLCNASGSYGKCIAEYTIAMMISCGKQFKHFINLMNENTWGERIGGKEIFHSRILIVGLGDIGYECAKRLKAFDCTVVGIKRRMMDLPPYIDELYTNEQLDEQLEKADYVILSLPNSKATYHMINEERLLKMKKDAIIINVGRGSAIDNDALAKVIQNGHLFAAGLDVQEIEPLPKEHPLWNIENVILTPHISGTFFWKSVRDFYVDLVIKNIQHIIKQEPLENTVDLKSGYRKQTVYQK